MVYTSVGERPLTHPPGLYPQNKINDQRKDNILMEDIYPMPAFAQLQVADLDRATRWYTNILGFRVIFAMPGHDGSPQLIHLRRSRYQDLLLVRPRQPR